MKGILIVIMMLFISCANNNKNESESTLRQITLYSSDGSIIKQWESNVVTIQGTSDGFFIFTDIKTNKHILISGTIIIETK